MKTNDIIRAYTKGELTAQEANAKLKAIGVNLRLVEGKNQLTAQEIAETHVGATPQEANGWGLLDVGVGGFEKVHVVDGVTVDYDKGADTNYALVLIGGKMYRIVNGNRLSELE